MNSYFVQGTKIIVLAAVTWTVVVVVMVMEVEVGGVCVCEAERVTKRNDLASAGQCGNAMMEAS